MSGGVCAAAATALRGLRSMPSRRTGRPRRSAQRWIARRRSPSPQATSRMETAASGRQVASGPVEPAQGRAVGEGDPVDRGEIVQAALVVRARQSPGRPSPPAGRCARDRFMALPPPGPPALSSAVSTIDTATALVSSTATRSPGLRAAANARIAGCTTTLSVAPFGGRERGDRGRRIVGDHGDDHVHGRADQARRLLAFRCPPGHHRAVVGPRLPGLGHAQRHALVVGQPDHVAGGELRQVADLGPATTVTSSPFVARSWTSRVCLVDLLDHGRRLEHRLAMRRLGGRAPVARPDAARRRPRPAAPSPRAPGSSCGSACLSSPRWPAAVVAALVARSGGLSRLSRHGALSHVPSQVTGYAQPPAYMTASSSSGSVKKDRTVEPSTMPATSSGAVL